MQRIFRPGRLLALVALGMVPVTQAADGFLVDGPGVFSNVRGKSGTPLTNFDAATPAIAAAPEEHIALVVWSADDAGTTIETDDEDTTLNLVDDEFEIFGNIADAGTRNSLSGQFRISFMGDDQQTTATERVRYAGRNPAVAWNPVAGEFLVVWEGDADDAPLVDGEFEIFGQRVDTEGELLGNRFRISTMGDDAQTSATERARYGAFEPAVSVDTVTGNWLVVWRGDHDAAPLVDEEFEIFGRLIRPDGSADGAQFRISAMGDDAETVATERQKAGASRPVVAYNPVAGNFFVAWQGDDGQNGLVDNEFEIFLQRLDAAGSANGAVVRVSAMGPDGDGAYDALEPALAVDSSSGTGLVTWSGDTDQGIQADNEFEIHGRLLDANAAFLGNSFRISAMGPDSEPDPEERARFKAETPHAAWNPKEQEFLVVWRGDTQTTRFVEDEENEDELKEVPHLVDDEFEIFGRLVRTDGEMSPGRFRISVQGSDSEEDAADRVKFAAEAPAVDYAAGAFFIVWNGELLDNHFQVFGRRGASNFTELKISVTGLGDTPVVPEPERLELTVTNSGDNVAEDMSIRVSQTEDFPLIFNDCDVVSEENVCELGDLEPGDSVTVELVFATDHIELGDPQITGLRIIPESTTAIANISSIVNAPPIFVRATLSIEGGAGAVGGFWLALLGGLALLGLRRRRSGS